jgi:hypothetical protein
LVEQGTDSRDYPLADSVDRNVPLYDGDRLRALAATPECHALTGPPAAATFRALLAA